MAKAGTGALISRALMLDVFARSFFIQAAWNVERMQNIGFLFAVRRALKSIWSGEPENFEAACVRAASFFNTHAYFAPAVMGVVLHLEEKISAGLALPERVEEAKLRISAPLNALGSLWFWENLRVLAFLIALPLILMDHPAAVAAGAGIAFLFFNYFHIRTRWIGLRLGLQYGEDMVPDLLKLFPSRLLQSFRRSGVFFLGISTPLALAVLLDRLAICLPQVVHSVYVPDLFFFRLLMGVAAVGLATAVLHSRWLSVYQLLALSLGLAVGVAPWL